MKTISQGGHGSDFEELPRETKTITLETIPQVLNLSAAPEKSLCAQTYFLYGGELANNFATVPARSLELNLGSHSRNSDVSSFLFLADAKLGQHHPVPRGPAPQDGLPRLEGRHEAAVRPELEGVPGQVQRARATEEEAGQRER